MKENEKKEPVWLIHPVALTMMRHDYSLVQMRMMVTVVGRLQGILHDVLNCRRTVQRGLFHPDELDDSGRLCLRVMFKELGVGANHYDRLGESLTQMSAMPVELPVKTPSGREYKQLPRLMDVKLGDGHEHNRYATVTMERDVATLVCSLQMGYQRLSLDAVFACRNRMSPRLYMLIAAWTDRDRVHISSEDLRRMLGQQTAYPKFADMLRRVVRPAAAEIKRLAQRGVCDCHFELEPSAAPSSRSDKPAGVSLKIIKNGGAADETSDAQRAQLAQMLSRHFGFRPDNAMKVAVALKAGCYQDMMSKLTTLYSRLNNDHSVKDRAAYVYRSIENMLEARA